MITPQGDPATVGQQPSLSQAIPAENVVLRVNSTLSGTANAGEPTSTPASKIAPDHKAHSPKASPSKGSKPTSAKPSTANATAMSRTVESHDRAGNSSSLASGSHKSPHSSSSSPHHSRHSDGADWAIVFIMSIFIGLLALWTLYECYREFRRTKQPPSPRPNHPGFQNCVGGVRRVEEIRVGPVIEQEPSPHRQQLQEELSLSGDKEARGPQEQQDLKTEERLRDGLVAKV